MNLRLITENDAAYQEIGFLTKSISTPYGRAMVMPTAWKLRVFLRTNFFTASIFFLIV